MCYYRLYIFLGCGHTSPSATPIQPCAAQRAKRPPRSAQPVETRKEHERRDSGNPLATDALADPRSSGTFQHAADSPDTSMSTAPATSTVTAPTATATAPIPAPAPAPQLNPNPNPDTETTEASTPSTPCASLSIHPFQTLNIHASCAVCQRKRMALLEQVEAGTAAVRFDDWRWKVKYKASAVVGEARSSLEARNSLEWGRSVGEAMGSWVRARGQEVWRVLGEEEEEEEEEEGGAGRGGEGRGWRGSL